MSATPNRPQENQPVPDTVPNVDVSPREDADILATENIGFFLQDLEMGSQWGRKAGRKPKPKAAEPPPPEPQEPEEFYDDLYDEDGLDLPHGGMMLAVYQNMEADAELTPEEQASLLLKAGAVYSAMAELDDQEAEDVPGYQLDKKA